MVLEAHMKLCVTERDFATKKKVSNIGKLDQKWAKKKFFEFIETFGH